MRLVAPLVAVVLLAAVGTAATAEDVVQARLDTSPGGVEVVVTIAPEWHVNAHEPRDEFLIPTTLTVEPPPGVRAGAVAYPAPVERQLAFAGSRPLRLYEGTVRLAAPLEGTPAPEGGPLRARLRYQACDATRCLPPRTLELTASMKARDSAPGDPLADNQVARVVARWGWTPAVLLVAILGLALNLTPCVYPLISVTVAYFGGRTGASDRRAVARSIVYVLGICLSFSALGVAAALTGSLFGAALQRPEVLGGVALVLVALAASNFGLYTLQLPAPLVNRVGRIGEGALGAFLMGLTMGVVAAPCIGPIVVGLLVFVGAQQSAALGFALFFTLGLGMGAPYVALAALAGRLRRLPRGGAWLAWVERCFGFLLLGVALWFAAPLLPPAVARAATVLVLLVAGVVLGFLGPREGGAFAVARRLGGLAVIGVGLASLLGAEARGGVPWMPFSENALAQARAERRPVLLNFEAEWCLPCHEMERTTFRDPEVVRVAGNFATLRVDLTEEKEPGVSLRDHFRVVGVPTYVLLGRDGRERRRLVGFVPTATMLEAMHAAAAAPTVEATRG